MSKITVTGGTKQQRSLVAECARDCLRRVLGLNKAKEGKKRNIRFFREAVIEIELIKNLSKKEDCKGDCTWSDNRKNPLEFEIRLDSSMNMVALLVGVAHEMVHVRQYITGEMRDTSRWNICIWQGKKINWAKIDYFDHPWEIEAYGREAGLFEKFAHDYNYSETKWAQQDPDYV